MRAIEFIAQNPAYRIDLADSVLGKLEAQFLRCRLADMRAARTQVWSNPIPGCDAEFVARDRSDLLERSFSPAQLSSHGGVWRKKTSGSSAEPAVVFYSRRFYLEQLFLNVRVIADSWKIPYFDRNVFSMTLVAVSRWPSLVLDDPLGETGVATRRVFDEREPSQVASLIDEIVRLRPVVLAAKPPLFEAILMNSRAKLLGRAGIRLIISSGAQLTFALRRDLAALFESPICNAYALSEAGLVAFECCRSGAMRIHNSGLIVDVMGSNSHVPSAKGQILVTSKMNSALHLDQYRTGDLAEIRSPNCPCGHCMPSLVDLTGKLVPCWEFDGRCFDSSRFDYRLFEGLNLNELRFVVRRTMPNQLEFLFNNDDWRAHGDKIELRAKGALGPTLARYASVRLATNAH